MKKYVLPAIFLSVAILVAAFFIFARLNGSGFQAAVLRGVTMVKVALVSKPAPTVLLPVEFDKQDHALSCEIATLKMVLKYRGVAEDEETLIQKIGFDPTPKTKDKKGNLIWGDPEKAFVGDIDGKMLVDGYGVYWLPIENVARDYRDAISFEGWDEKKLANEISHGNPVIIWGFLGSGKPASWRTVDGKQISTVYYEHTFVVHGFSGDAENPTGYFLIDPIYGEIYQSKQAFLKKWDAFGRSGVIVY